MVTINTILCFLNISLYYVLNSENETSNFNLFKNYFGYLFEFPQVSITFRIQIFSCKNKKAIGILKGFGYRLLLQCGQLNKSLVFYFVFFNSLLLPSFNIPKYIFWMCYKYIFLISFLVCLLQYVKAQLMFYVISPITLFELIYSKRILFCFWRIQVSYVRDIVIYKYFYFPSLLEDIYLFFWLRYCKLC